MLENTSRETPEISQLTDVCVGEQQCRPHSATLHEQEDETCESTSCLGLRHRDVRGKVTSGPSLPLQERSPPLQVGFVPENYSSGPDRKLTLLYFCVSLIFLRFN